MSDIPVPQLPDEPPQIPKIPTEPIESQFGSITLELTTDSKIVIKFHGLVNSDAGFKEGYFIVSSHAYNRKSHRHLSLKVILEQLKQYEKFAAGSAIDLQSIFLLLLLKNGIHVYEGEVEGLNKSFNSILDDDQKRKEDILQYIPELLDDEL